VGGGGEGGGEGFSAGKKEIGVGPGQFHPWSFREGCRLGAKTQRVAAV
jgi:hypothetical protein